MKISLNETILKKRHSLVFAKFEIWKIWFSATKIPLCGVSKPGWNPVKRRKKICFSMPHHSIEFKKRKKKQEKFLYLIWGSNQSGTLGKRAVQCHWELASCKEQLDGHFILVLRMVASWREVLPNLCYEKTNKDCNPAEIWIS